MVIDAATVVALVALIAAIVGGAIARDRQISTMISEARKTSASAEEKLHERVNRLRDDMSDGYVRRVDLEGHIVRIEKQIDTLTATLSQDRAETNKRLDAVLQALRKE